jgi:hypothetical protein
MECSEARRILADPKSEAASRASASAHIASCSACQIRADQFAMAILSGAEEEIPCAECLARIDALVAGALAGEGGDPAADDAQVAAHVAACPECDEAFALLLSGLAGLRDGSLAELDRYPSFDLSFARQAIRGADAARSAARAGALAGTAVGTEAAAARSTAGAAAMDANAAAPDGAARAWAQRRRSWIVAVMSLVRVLRGRLLGRWRGLDSATWQGFSRTALAGLALLVLGIFAWLRLLEPRLPETIRGIRPFGGPTATLSQAEVEATQTMAVQMGIDWVDAAGGATLTAGTPLSGVRSGTPSPAALRSATPSPTPTRTPTALPAGQRKEDRERGGDPRGAPTQAPDPSEKGTSTPAGGGDSGYPPPPSDTPPPYPGPRQGPSVPREPDPPGLLPTAAPEPSQEPGPGLGPDEGPNRGESAGMRDPGSDPYRPSGMRDPSR